MTTETHTPFNEYFSDSIIAKNLLANNTCKTCKYRKLESRFHGSKYRELLWCYYTKEDDEPISSKNTCINWE